MGGERERERDEDRGKGMDKYPKLWDDSGNKTKKKLVCDNKISYSLHKAQSSS
jgi:hypothetical protein